MVTQTDNTIGNLKNLWIEIFLDKTNKVSNIADGSILNATAYGTAKVAQKAIKDIAITEAKLFPDTATGEYLDKCAALYGVSPRKSALGSSTYIRVYARPGTYYDESIIFVNKNGIRFSVDQPLTVDSTGYGYVSVRSVNAGFATNVPPNSIVTVTPQPIGHIECTNEYYAIGGRDTEDDETFRIRIKNNNNKFSKGTVEYWTQILQEIDPRVLKVLNVGLGENGSYELYIVSQNGIFFTQNELDIMLEQSKEYFGLFELNLEGDTVGIVFKNAEWFYIGSERGLDFRVDINPEYDIVDIRKNIQVNLTKYLDFRFWETNKSVQWDDLLDVVKKAQGVKFVPDEFFFPWYDEAVPVNQLPRIRGFIMRDLKGNILYDSNNTLSPLFYPAQSENIFRGLTDSSLALSQPVYFNILDEQGNPVEGARVSVGNNSILTDAKGQGILSLVNGNYNYTISKSRYNIYQGTFIVLNNSVTIDVVLVLAPYLISFKILDEDGQPIPNVEIAIDDKIITTNTNGLASMAVKKGTYSYNLTKLGYDQISDKSVTVEDQDMDVIEIMYLTAWDIYIIVQDESSQFLSGVIIQIGENSYLTDEQGKVQLALVNGDYRIFLKKIGYNSLSKGFTVRNQEETFTYQMTFFEYDFSLKVVAPDKISPVQNALVTVNNGLYSAVTDRDGGISLKLINGNYSYSISKREYDDFISNFNIQNANLDLTAVLVFKHFEVIITAIDENQIPVSGAIVTINNQVFTTDIRGQIVASLQNGTYNYTITKLGYYDYQGKVVVFDNDISVVANITGHLYNVLFTIMSERNQPIENAIILIYGRSLTTNNLGQASTTLINGTYDYTVSKLGYISLDGETTVANQDQNVNITLQDREWDITFLISDRGAALAGVTITIGGKTLTTNESGIANTTLINGLYSYTLIKEGYVQEQGQLTIDNSNLSKELSMEPMSYLVTFNITEARKDNTIVPLEGVTISIEDQNLVTDSEGKTSLEIYAGSYPILYKKEGYQDIDTSIEISGNITINESLNKYYELTFEVSSITRSLLEGATVNVSGPAIVNGPIEVTTNAQGQTNPIAVINGDYSYNVFLTGHSPEEGTGSISDSNKVQSVDLVFGIETTFAVTGEIYSIANGVYIQDSEGNLYTSDQWKALVTKPTPNGVAVVNGPNSFVIATIQGPRLQFGPKNFNLNRIKRFPESEITKDFDGKYNTTQIIAQLGSSSPAAEYCANYTFPNGQKGYVGSAGEWNTALSYKDKIDEIITLIGAAPFTNYNILTSSAPLYMDGYWAYAYWPDSKIGFVNGILISFPRPITDLKIPFIAGHPIQDTSIKVDGAETKNTDAEGKVMFNLSNGEHSYIASKSGYLPIKGDVIVNDKPQEIPVSLKLGAVVNFIITDDKVVLSGAEITINSKAKASIVGITDNLGKWSTELLNGEYTYIISKEGYTDTTEIFFEVKSNELNISEDLQNKHLWNITLDGIIKGSSVAFKTGSGIVIETKTADSTGQVVFTNVNGSYIVEIKKEGYFDTSISINVANANYSRTVTQDIIKNVVFKVVKASDHTTVIPNVVIVVDGISKTTDNAGTATFQFSGIGQKSYTATPPEPLLPVSGTFTLTESTTLNVTVEIIDDTLVTFKVNEIMQEGAYIYTEDGQLLKPENLASTKKYADGVYIEDTDGNLHTRAEWEAATKANGVYIKGSDGKLYTRSEWSALTNVITNGVYIQDSEGNLYTQDQWKALSTKPTPNGVAVVDGPNFFVIAMETSPTTLKWSEESFNVRGIANGIVNTNPKDFAGEYNTAQIIYQARPLKAPAAAYCADYTFPNGQKGHLPSDGEWMAAYNNVAAINDCMTLIGKTIPQKTYWTSCQIDTDFVSTQGWNSSISKGSTNKTYAGASALPFGPLVTPTLLPSGVVVISDEASFEISLSDYYTTLPWDRETYGQTLIDGIMTTTNTATAQTDYKGEYNTAKIISQLKIEEAPVAGYCANHTFPDGQKGYLGSLGEWQEAYNNKTEIDACMSLIGGTAIYTSAYHWTSTQYSSTSSWRLHWSDGSADNGSKRNNYRVRAFASASKSPYIPNSIVVIKDTVAFKIALTRFPDKMAWGTPINIEITNTVNGSQSNNKLTDMAGRHNTRKIFGAYTNAATSGIAEAIAPAANSCLTYKYPNGQYGYLGSSGEWNIAINYKNEVDACLTATGNPTIFASLTGDDSYWTSTKSGIRSNAVSVERYSTGVEVDNSYSRSELKYIIPFGYFNQYQSEPVGVALITKDNQTLIALEESPGGIISTKIPVGLTGVPAFNDSKTYFNGKEDTLILVNSNNNNPCALYANDYSYGNISAGNWYLPSGGQLEILLNYLDSVRNCLSKLNAGSILPSLFAPPAMTADEYNLVTSTYVYTGDVWYVSYGRSRKEPDLPQFTWMPADEGSPLPYTVRPVTDLNLPMERTPLQGVTIAIEDGNSGITDTAGTTSISVSRNKDHSFIAKKDTYIPYNSTTGIVTDEKTIEFDMQKGLQVIVTVKHNSTGSVSGVSSVTVQLIDPATSKVVEEADTDSNGIVIFYVKPGIWEFYVEGTYFYEESRSRFTISADTAISIAYRQKYNITVSAKRASVPQQGVVFTLGTLTATTSTDGNASYSMIPYETGVTLSCAKGDYWAAGSMKIDIDANKTVEVALAPLYVVKIETGQLQAIVTLSGSTGSQSFMTTSNTYVEVVDVPVGTFSYTIQKAGYLEISETCTIDQETELQIDINATLQKLPKLVQITATGESTVTIDTSYQFMDILVIGGGGTGRGSNIASTADGGMGGASGGILYVVDIPTTNNGLTTPFTATVGEKEKDSIFKDASGTLNAIGKGNTFKPGVTTFSCTINGSPLKFRNVSCAGGAGGSTGYGGGGGESLKGQGSNPNGTTGGAGGPAGDGGGGKYGGSAGILRPYDGVVQSDSTLSIIPIQSIFNGTGGPGGKGNDSTSFHGGGGGAAAYGKGGGPNLGGFGAGGLGGNGGVAYPSGQNGISGIICIYYHDGHSDPDWDKPVID